MPYGFDWGSKPRFQYNLSIAFGGKEASVFGDNPPIGRRTGFFACRLKAAFRNQPERRLQTAGWATEEIGRAP